MSSRAVGQSDSSDCGFAEIQDCPSATSAASQTHHTCSATRLICQRTGLEREGRGVDLSVRETSARPKQPLQLAQRPQNWELGQRGEACTIISRAR